MALKTKLAATNTRRQYENRAVFLFFCDDEVFPPQRRASRRSSRCARPLQVWVLTIRVTPSGRNAWHSKGMQPRRSVRKQY